MAFRRRLLTGFSASSIAGKAHFKIRGEDFLLSSFLMADWVLEELWSYAYGRP